MDGGEEPAGLNGAARPAPSTLSAHPLPIASSLLLDPTPDCFLREEKRVGPAGLGLGQKFLKFFVKFY